MCAEGAVLSWGQWARRKTHQTYIKNTSFVVIKIIVLPMFLNPERSDSRLVVLLTAY